MVPHEDGQRMTIGVIVKRTIDGNVNALSNTSRTTIRACKPGQATASHGRDCKQTAP